MSAATGDGAVAFRRVPPKRHADGSTIASTTESRARGETEDQPEPVGEPVGSLIERVGGDLSRPEAVAPESATDETDPAGPPEDHSTTDGRSTDDPVDEARYISVDTSTPAEPVAGPHGTDTAGQTAATEPDAHDGPQAVEEPERALRKRKVSVRLPPALRRRVRDEANRQQRFLDELLLDALRAHGREVADRLAETPGVERRRKGVEGDSTIFVIHPSDQSFVADLEARSKPATAARFYSEVFEAFFAQASAKRPSGS